MNIDEFFNDLAANSSRNYKIEQLKKYSDNETLKKCVRLALDPFTQFFIRKIPSYTPAMNIQADSLDSVLDSLGMLSRREVTGNAAIDYLKKLLSSLVYNDAKVIERIISKDLKCGVSTATANAVWDNLVPEYPCMLCSQYEDKLMKGFKFPAYAQLKMDGMRFNAIVKEGKVELRSRNGKLIEGLDSLESQFLSLNESTGNCVFDGELLVVDENGVANRQTGNGILNKAVKGTISKEEADLIVATVWDIISYDDFLKGISKTHYYTRFNYLEYLTLPDKIRLVESKLVKDEAEARTVFNSYLEQGQEGIILKDMTGIWENKRTKSQIKFKAELVCELKVVGIEEGTGKYSGMMGAAICESSDGVIKVSVGSGFTDDDRKNLDLLDKIISVKYNARIRNKQGEESLFLPIFLSERPDKESADSSKDIK